MELHQHNKRYTMKKKTNVKQLIRTIVREEVAMAIREVAEARGPRSSELIQMFPGSRIMELAACGLELEASCLGLEACCLELESLGA